MFRRFEGKVAIVTGSGRGIGAATAKRLAREGAKVGVVDLKEEYCLDTVNAIKEAGGDAIPLVADVSEATQVEAAVNTMMEKYGQIDILVNNAGIIRDNLVYKMTEEDWDRVIDVHLKGTFLFSKAVLKHMVERRYGKVVNTSSLGARGNRGQANYSSAKAGIQALTRTLAIEFGPYNINVNCVAPGAVATDMTRSSAARRGIDFEKLSETVAQRIPMRRIGVPDDIANVIAFLVSDEASYIAGETINVNGGDF